jgi:hypothetical protein
MKNFAEVLKTDRKLQLEVAFAINKIAEKYGYVSVEADRLLEGKEPVVLCGGSCGFLSL